MTATLTETIKGTLVGYARCSTGEQNVDDQTRCLESAGCVKVFRDVGVSGKYASRPQWDQCMQYLRPGDTLCVIKLDRAGRSLKHLINLVEELKERGIGLKVLDQGIDTSTPAGMLFFHVLGALSEFERELIIERTLAGQRTARLNGKVFGRPAKLSAEQQEAVWDFHLLSRTSKRNAERYKVSELAKTFGVTKQVIYRLIAKKMHEAEE